VPAPSGLAFLTTLRELGLICYTMDDNTLIEEGAHLLRLERLSLNLQSGGDLVDLRRRIIAPLRSATSLTELGFAGYPGPSQVLQTMDRINDLLEGKPALRRFAFQKEHALKRDLELDALQKRHPVVESVLGGREWWAPPPPRGRADGRFRIDLPSTIV
jgi:hypothetical protein